MPKSAHAILPQSLSLMASCSERLVYSETLDAVGGYRREEAIMLLRRFYATENKHGM